MTVLSQKRVITTLWVIFGPFAASEVCAKKTNAKVKMTRTETTILWKLIIVE